MRRVASKAAGDFVGVAAGLGNRSPGTGEDGLPERLIEVCVENCAAEGVREAGRLGAVLGLVVVLRLWLFSI